MDAKPRVGKFAESSFSGSFHSGAGVACERFKKVKFLGCCKFLAFSGGKKFPYQECDSEALHCRGRLAWLFQTTQALRNEKLRQIIICNKYVMKISFRYGSYLHKL